MHILLKLKSWQLFLLLIGIAGLAHLLLNPLLPEHNRHFLLLSPFEISLLLLLLSWFWILGIWLNGLVLEELRFGTILFTLSIILPIAIVISLQTLFIFCLFFACCTIYISYQKIWCWQKRTLQSNL